MLVDCRIGLRMFILTQFTALFSALECSCIDVTTWKDAESIIKVVLPVPITVFLEFGANQKYAK